MDNKNKILLGNKDILSKNIKDVFLNISLNKNSKELCSQKYDNNFDLNTFYDKERNESRTFIIYGTIDSYVWDCDDLNIKIYQSKNLEQQNLLCETKTKPIDGNLIFKNIYNKNKGKYFCEIPTSFTGFSVYIDIETPETHYVDEQQLIYTTLTISNSGEKIVKKLPYGLNEVVIDCDGNFLEINNNFDFFYNKHWIRKNINIFDNRTKWIPDIQSSYCETIKDPIFNGRKVSGIFNTGNLIFTDINEVYLINNEPTGNKKKNVNTSNNYIPPIQNTGSCRPPSIYNFKIQKKLLPNNYNKVYTSFDDWSCFSTVDIYPENLYITKNEDNIIKVFEREIVSGQNKNDIFINNYWEFSNFEISGDTNIFSGNTFIKKITGDTTVFCVYKEKCPFSLNINTKFDDINNISTIPEIVFSTITFKNNIEYINKKEKFKNNEKVDIRLTDVNNPYSYYIHNFALTGSSYLQNTKSTKQKIKDIELLITSNTFVDLVYRNYNNMVISSTTQSNDYKNVGKINIKCNSEIIPSMGKSIYYNIDLLNNYTFINNLFSNSDIYISYKSQPSKNPNLYEIWSGSGIPPSFVFINQGNELKKINSVDEFPGTWKWECYFSGASLVSNNTNGYINEGVLHIKNSGNTIIQNLFLFEPVQYFL